MGMVDGVPLCGCVPSKSSLLLLSLSFILEVILDQRDTSVRQVQVWQPVGSSRCKMPLLKRKKSVSGREMVGGGGWG